MRVQNLFFRGANLSRIGHVTQDHLHSSCNITSTPPAISPPLLHVTLLIKGVSRIFKGFSRIFQMSMQEYFKVLSRFFNVLSRFFNVLSRLFQGSFKALSLLFPGSLNSWPVKKRKVYLSTNKKQDQEVSKFGLLNHSTEGLYTKKFNTKDWSEYEYQTRLIRENLVCSKYVSIPDYSFGQLFKIYPFI